MEIKIEVNKSYCKLKVIILTDKIDDRVNNLLKKLSKNKTLIGFRDNHLEIIQPDDIIHIFSENKKVYVQTTKSLYTLKLCLYKLEENLEGSSFVRISNSEIINLKRVKNMDLSSPGTMCINLENGTKTYVSRRYIKKIKQRLTI